MDQVLLCSSHIPLTTSISNSFIKKYMLNANGSYVKVYLYLSMCIQSNMTNLSISSLADMMENTEKDIIRALQYWEKKKLMLLQRSESDGGIIGISLLNTDDDADSSIAETVASQAILDTPSDAAPSQSVLTATAPDSTIKNATPQPQAIPETPVNTPPDIEVTKEQAERLAQNDDFSWTCLIVESYLERPLQPKEVELLTYLFDNLKFSKDLILYLYEYCCSIKKTNVKYVQTVALSWADKHITTPDEAQTFSQKYSECHSAICKTLGLGRPLAAIEVQYVNRWQNEWNMDLAVILEACNRTMLAIQKPDFKYLDGILANWHKNTVHTLQDIQVCDDNFNKKKSATNKQTVRNANNAGKKNQFQAFEQRNTSSDEIDKLEKMLLNR